MSYHERDTVIPAKIRSLFTSLTTSTYSEVVPKIEYWIECALNEQLVRVDKLVEKVSPITWDPLVSAPSGPVTTITCRMGL